MPDFELEDEGPPLGTILEGRYELVDHLGEGGVGWVYRAKHLRLGTEVAIKMLQAPYAQHESLRPRFEREAKALAALRHPHIVTLTDYSITEDGHPYLVMEALEGKTLADLIDEGPVEEQRARRILSQMLDALIYAHGRGFAHRDLKPSNIFLVELPTDPDHVKILDFGFVKLVGSDRAGKPGLTRSGMAFGTPSYMCPEQATGAPTDPRSDLYSAGIVYFEMVAGRRPFVGEIPDVIRQHLTEPVPPLHVGGLPIAAGPELRDFLDKTMAKDPRDRYATATEMKQALAALPTPAVRDRPVRKGQSPPERPPSLEATKTEPTHPATPAAPMTRAATRRSGADRRSLAGLGAIVLIALAAGLAIWFAIHSNVSDAGAVQGGSGDDADARAAELEAGEPEPSPIAPDPSALHPNEGDPSLPPYAEGPESPEAFDQAWEDATDEVEGALEEGALDEGADEGAGDEGAGDEGVEAQSPVAAAAEDPWLRLEAVPLLARARAVVAEGQPLPRDLERDVRRYVREHRDDARAHIVLAQHFAARGFDLSAVQRYSLALRVDPGAARDPRMLSDLVRLASQPTVTEEAAELLRRGFGAGSLPEIDRVLASGELDRPSAERLTAARAQIVSGEP
jgi:serine/threonine-protein kinase